MKAEFLEVMTKAASFGAIGLVFAIVRILTVQEARTWQDFFIAVAVAVPVCAVVGLALEDFGVKWGVSSAILGITGIVAQNIVLLMIRLMAEITDNPKGVLDAIREIIFNRGPK